MAESTEQSDFWDVRADAWVCNADAMEDFAQQFGGPAMERFQPARGEHVADVGCGPGLTTVELARRVGPDGSATGVDVSTRMVEAARARAAREGVDNARFESGDPGAGPIGSFDGVYSRFGVMFFDHPPTAFTNIARSIRPGGRFVAVVWAELDANPWMFLPTLFAAGPLQAELALPGPDEPGPFSLADPDKAMVLLESCGFWDLEVVRQGGEWAFDVVEADDAIARMLAVGAVGEAWARADEGARAAAVAAVHGACSEHRRGDRFSLPAAACTISAAIRP